MDIQLYYQEKGEGTPMILLHGNDENSDYFEHQIAYFSQHYRVIAIDTRGHGRSPRGTAPFTIAQFADDLDAFMTLHGIERAILLGFSDGANIAMKFALKYQEKVLALILDGGNLDASGVERKAQSQIEWEYRIAKVFAPISKRARHKYEMNGLMVNDPNIVPSELHAIHVPTLVIAGTRDVILEAHTRLIAENIRTAELALVEGDHFVAAKEPKAFNEAVHHFLTSNL